MPTLVTDVEMGDQEARRRVAREVLAFSRRSPVRLARVRTAAVLPVKSFSRAKQRLGEAVGGSEREELAAAMVGDVLARAGRRAARSTRSSW